MILTRYFILFLIATLTYTSLLSQGETISIGKEYSMFSKILNEERTFYVHVPDEFYGMDSAGVIYPTLYTLDGQGMFSTAVGITNQMSSPYVAGDLIPKMIVVGIPNTDRNRDLTPSSAAMGGDSSFISRTGGGSKFLNFVEKELVPFIDSSFKTAPHRTFVGHSLGGLSVLQAMVEKPNLFDYYLSIDPDLSWDDKSFLEKVVDTISERAFSKQRIFIAGANTTMPWMSEEEVRKDTTDILRILVSYLIFQDRVALIDNESLDIEFRFYEDENHFQVPIPAIYDGLKSLFRNYSFRPMVEYYHPGSPQNQIDIVEALKEHFGDLSLEMGYEVKPLESYINSWAFGFLQFGKKDLTENLLKYNLELYPNSRHARIVLEDLTNNN